MTETSIEAIYNVWAPAGCPWSPWVKPVLFAAMHGPPPPDLPPPPVTSDVSWLLEGRGKVALVLDLPREEGVNLGLEMAASGWRPVPLYNAIPATHAHLRASEIPMTADSDSVVDVTPIMHALWRGVPALSAAALPLDAPPAFLLDASRRVGRMRPVEGGFDNRSVSFTSDFPSAIFLKSRGIDLVILVQRLQDQPQPDLAHTLRGWQEGGIPVKLKRLDVTGAVAGCHVPRPSLLGAIWYRLWAAFRLRRNELGGSGGTIGQSSGG